MITNVCVSYPPHIAHKILQKYLLGKMWKIEIPEINPTSKEFPMIIIKEPIAEDSKAQNELNLPNPLNWREYEIHPKTLVWNCKDPPTKISWNHKMAYMFQGVQLPIEPVIQNNLIAPVNYKWKKDSKRLKKVYFNILEGINDKKVAQEKSELFKINQVVNDYKVHEQKVMREVKEKLKKEKESLEESKKKLKFQIKIKKQNQYLANLEEMNTVMWMMTILGEII